MIYIIWLTKSSIKFKVLQPVNWDNKQDINASYRDRKKFTKS